MRRRSLLGIIGAFAAGALPFGHHEALADRGPRYVPNKKGFVDLTVLPFVLTRDATEVVVANTTTETELFGYEIPPNYLAGDHAVRLQLVGTQKNDTVVATENTLRWRVKLGSTTLWDSTGQNSAGDGGAYEAPWRFDLTITETGVAEQMLTGAAWVVQTTATPPTTGAGSLTGGANVVTLYGTSAEDETTALTLSVTVENSVADPDINCTKRFASLELL